MRTKTGVLGMKILLFGLPLIVKVVVTMVSSRSVWYICTTTDVLGMNIRMRTWADADFS